MSYFSSILGNKILPNQFIEYDTTINTGNVIILCDPTISSGVTITLPDVATVPDGKYYFIGDISGEASIYNVTINSASSSDYIDSAISYTLNVDFGAVGIYCKNSSGWYIFSEADTIAI